MHYVVYVLHEHGEDPRELLRPTERHYWDYVHEGFEQTFLAHELLALPSVEGADGPQEVYSSLVDSTGAYREGWFRDYPHDYAHDGVALYPPAPPADTQEAETYAPQLIGEGWTAFVRARLAAHGSKPVTLLHVHN
jgi:hypothetical protein